MSTALKELAYPHITSHPGIADGVPIIEGTRIAVHTIAGYYQMGMDVDEILTTLSHLTAFQVHSALAHYFDHQQEIDTAIAEHSDEEFWKHQINTHRNLKDQVLCQRFRSTWTRTCI